MSHWNYRIFHTQFDGHLYNQEEPIHTYDVREVYYNDNGDITAISSTERAPFGETLEELKNAIQKMELAFLKPVLVPDDVPGYEYDAFEIR